MMIAATIAPSPTPGAEPIVDLSAGTAVWVIVGIAAGLALLWAIPLYLDARRAYKAYRNLQIPLMDRMLKAAEADKLKLTDPQMDALITAATQRFEATAGLARALMAFAVISILGMALVAVLLSSADDASDLRKTIITALLSILGTIVGFYFGARTAEISAKGSEGEKVPKPKTPETPPDTKELPRDGTAEGTGGGDRRETEPG